MLDPLKEGIRARESLRNRVYVLTGAGTFSSGKDEALFMRQGLRTLPAFSMVKGIEFSTADLLKPPTGATLVGEPVSGKLNQYGNIKEFTLPHSRLLVICTTQFFRRISDGDPSELRPDIPAPMTLTDALAGKDVPLETALAQIVASGQ